MEKKRIRDLSGDTGRECNDWNLRWEGKRVVTARVTGSEGFGGPWVRSLSGAEGSIAGAGAAEGDQP